MKGYQTSTLDAVASVTHHRTVSRRLSWLNITGDAHYMDHGCKGLDQPTTAGTNSGEDTNKVLLQENLLVKLGEMS